LLPLLNAMPDAWWPLLEKHVAERQQVGASMGPTRAEDDDLTILEGLCSLAPFRHRRCGMSIFPIISADQRLSERRGAKILLVGPTGVRKTSNAAAQRTCRNGLTEEGIGAVQ
jgi:hypothetical protein